MKIAIGLLCLVTFLIPQQPASERTVALVFREPSERVLIISESQARKEYEELSKVKNLSIAQRSRFSALVIALGTLPPEPVDLSCLTPQEKERIRWHRLPAQAQNPCEGRQ